AFLRVFEAPDGERRRFDLSSLRLLVHSAAPCPVPLKYRVIEAFAPCEVAEFYGMSEGGAPRISMVEWLRRPGSVGKPWPGVELTIRNELGEEVPVGTPGLVYVRPPGGVRFHYHDDAEKTASTVHGDVFTVGD